MTYFWAFLALYAFGGVTANLWFAMMPIWLSLWDRLVIFALWPAILVTAWMK